MNSRTLVIVRHAKAEAPDGLPDIERSLTERGHADAAAAGAWLARRGYAPEVVFCSPARRTRQTWHGVALALSSAPAVRYEEVMYAAPATTLLELVRGLDDSIGQALLVGHNPGVSGLAALLDPDAFGEGLDGLRTAGIAVHEVSGGWAECGERTARVLTAHTARDS